MRHYPRNSPEAAGRILALALLADGHLCKREFGILDMLDAHGRIGLPRQALHTVVHNFCEDLLSAMHLCWGDACRVDPDTLASLMADIDDPALRRTLMALCQSIVEADDHVAEGEAQVLLAAIEHWGSADEPAAAPTEPRVALPLAG